MEKTCSECGEPYWSRWRNDPADPRQRCPECRGDVRFCSHCGVVIAGWPSTDRHQLGLWPIYIPEPRTDRSHEVDFWYTMRERASLAERRQNPYQ